MQNDTREAVLAARNALAAAMDLIQAARVLWSRDEPHDHRLGGAFPFSSHIPTDPVGAAALLAEIDKGAVRLA